MFQLRFIRRTFPFLLILGVFLAGVMLRAVGQPAKADSKAALKSTTAVPSERVYRNTLAPIANPPPLLADYPEFVQPVVESRRFEAPLLVDDAGADLEVRAWRFSYNARGVIEMPNRLRLKDTAVIMVHPSGTDNGHALADS